MDIHEFKQKQPEHPYKGKYVIVRSDRAGVFSGYLESYDSVTKTVFLKECSLYVYLTSSLTLLKGKDISKKPIYKNIPNDSVIMAPITKPNPRHFSPSSFAVIFIVSYKITPLTPAVLKNPFTSTAGLTIFTVWFESPYPKPTEFT